MRKKIKVIIIVLVILFIICLIALLANKKQENEEIQNIISNSAKEDNIVSSKRIMDYIDTISGNYYMKYVMQIENSEGKLEPCTVEVSVDGDNIAMNSNEQSMSVIKKNNKLYYVMHDAEMVIINNINSSETYDIDSYKVSLSKRTMEDSFITTGMETINEVSYYYEEYSANDGKNTKLRYYFNEDSLAFIKTIYTEGKEELIEIKEISNKVYEPLFSIPSNYTQNDLSD